MWQDGNLTEGKTPNLFPMVLIECERSKPHRVDPKIYQKVAPLHKILSYFFLIELDGSMSKTKTFLDQFVLIRVANSNSNLNSKNSVFFCPTQT